MKEAPIPIQKKPADPPAGLSPHLNQIPETCEHVHLMGICGAGMASLAGMFHERGYYVTGSDQNIYPPMSHYLQTLSVPVYEGYGADNLRGHPDLVVVGNVITRDNPEAQALARLGLPYASFPQALNHFALAGKRSVVISGTHGKTTTSALVAWFLERAGLDPGFMIGGIPGNFQRNFKLGSGPYFVIEGDEYDTAFFDKGPKFLHYRPWVTVLTSIEFDHADIYRDLDHVTESFRKLIHLIPPEGLLIANGDDPVVAAEIGRARCPVRTFSLSPKGHWRPEEIREQEGGTHLKVLRGEKEPLHLTTPLYGRHNISNLISAAAVAFHLGVPDPVLADAAQGFKGVARRQEVVGEKRGILVLDDFAHHPTAVRETLAAVRGRYPRRRIVAVFEPRSNSSSRRVFQGRYTRAFDSADLVLAREPSRAEKIPPGERFSSARLAEDLRARGIESASFEDTDLLLETLVHRVLEGDVILVMSNGPFDNLPLRLLEAL